MRVALGNCTVDDEMSVGHLRDGGDVVADEQDGDVVGESANDVV